ncbi:MAG: HAMP domain-containing sensor histidine kinase [Elusimicrobiota bacterium]
MTIKNRLVLSFCLMIGIIVVIASVLFFQSNVQRYYLQQSVKNYSIMAVVREMQYFLEKSANAFDFYLVLGDTLEKNRFNEYSKGLKQKANSYIQQVADFKADKSEYDNCSEVVGLCDRLISGWKNIITICDSDSKKKAITLVDKDILPYLNKLKNKTSEIYLSKNVEFNKVEKRSITLEKTNFFISIGFSIIAVMLAIVLCIVIFRSISNPLSKLEEGAEKIGAGNFNYEIIITGHNELTMLAESFNKMAKNLKSSETQILQLDRMTSLGQLAVGIAHELNNPLTGVLGQSQIILEKISMTDPLREIVEKIIKAAERCRKITKGLLDFSRQRDYHFELLDITKVIDSSVEISASDIVVAKIIVTRNYYQGIVGDFPKINISISHLQQVFLNIITNAIHSMKVGGALSITTTVITGMLFQDGLDNKLSTDGTVVTAKKPSFVQISFEDTGDGITSENLKKMFTPFFTTKDPGKGTGLGLAISHGIIQKHGGEIIASSFGKGKGATITIRLPVGE